MATESGRWWWTCLCAGYLCLVNMVMLLIGLAVLAFGIWMVVKDPFANPSWHSFRELGNVAASKWAAFAAGGLIVVATAFGMAFARKRNRCVGCIYLLLVIAAIVLELVVMLVVVAGLSWNFSKLDEVSVKYMQDHETGETYQKLKKNGQGKIISHTFYTWAGTWNNPDSTDNLDCSFDDEKPPVLLATSIDTILMRRRLDAESKCRPEKREITCTNAKKFADVTSEWCRAKGDGDVYKKSCSACVGTWWELWDMDKYENKDVKDLKGKWEGDPGASYCRCLATFMHVSERYSHYIKIGAIVLGSIQLALVLATIWLMCWGPTAPKDDEDNSELELYRH